MSALLSNRLLPALWISMLLIGFSPVVHSQQLTTSSPTPAPQTADEENPFAKFAQAPRRRIPTGWKVAGVLVAVAIAAAVLWISVRVWRSSNLFDRQYRFPAVQSAALRLGATRSGGTVATISFRNRAGPSPEIRR